MHNKIGAEIQKNRHEKGMTLTELAEKTGLKYQTIQKYEKGEISNIPLNKLQKIADALKVNPADFMGWTSEPGTGHFEPGSDMSYKDQAMNTLIEAIEPNYSTKLTKQEAYMLEAYRSATDEARMEAFMILTKGAK